VSRPPLLEVRDLAKSFEARGGWAERLAGAAPRRLQAVRGVSLALAEGETLGLVGESGCGKSTLGRCIVGLYPPSAGEILYRGQKLHGPGADRQAVSRRVQMIFQDPFASLNPRLTVGSALAEVVAVHDRARGRAKIAAEVDRLLRIVGLAPEQKDRLPHEFSGGQRQRVSIARALAVEPELIVADDRSRPSTSPSRRRSSTCSASCRRALGLAYIFIAHDLAVVRHISDRIAVMYLGEIVELAPAGRLFERPGHPYTRSLLGAIPAPDPARRRTAPSLEGELPDPTRPPPGCSFHTRCPLAVERCRREAPALLEHAAGQSVRCHRAFEAGPPL
jgi:oligopeptide/dipeptide ABC transporter ATP-binding protein